MEHIILILGSYNNDQGELSHIATSRLMKGPIVPCIFYMSANKLLFCLGMIGWFSRLQANGLLAECRPLYLQGT
ncbi:hypothetical protein [Legionella longbeachae]|uniref:hypothetical protein n=1 Tax=Legionella longbeachae TaxID=450 RepID=UPI000F6F1CC3|nr:hypothetical protein [Legionella longbeachae]RZV26494.1 hypothetical protein EKG34_04965 [Legionella longbeachae]UAK47268.1 hypothetical protein K8O86_03500 [Legionella longbeachae]VEE04334.1 Uncharacterised protein [Legionella oakridgensis]